MKRINNISKNSLKNLYLRKKMTTYQIAEYYKCSQSTIWKLLHRCGISLRKRGNYLSIPRDALTELYVDKKLSSRKIAKIYNCAYSTIDRKIKKYGFKLRSLAQAHIIYPRRDFNGNLRDKAYLIGFAIGDLRVRKMYRNSETIVVDCGSTKSEQIKLIKDLFKVYGRVWISKKNKRNKRQIQAQLNPSFSFLLNLDGKIDRWIINNKDYFSHFLAGFTDAEGSFFISSGKAFYSLGNYKKSILDQIRKKLIQFGIYCSRPKSDNKKGYKDKLGYVRKQNYWTLRISRKQDVMSLFELIGCYLRHLKRRKDTENAKKNIIERNKQFHSL